MSKTHIFSQIEEALKLATYFEKRNISTELGLEQIEEVRWSRRKFLKTATATVGVLLGVSAFEPTTFARNKRIKSNNRRIVIVGAGCAGLTCAYRLKKRGLSVEVIEAGNRVGGRVLSLRNTFADGQIAELGGEFINTNHRSVLRLARELGIKLTDLKKPTSLDQELFYFKGRVIGQAELIKAFRPIAKQILRDLSTIPKKHVTYNDPNNGEKLDSISLAEWLDSRGVIGVIKSLLEVAYITEFGLDPADQSSLNLLFLIGRDKNKLDVYGNDDRRYRIAEGNDSLPTKLSKQLSQEIELETSLEAIRNNSDGSYLLTVNKSGKVQDIKADEVVITLPFTMLRKVDIKVEIPRAKRLAIDQLGYGTNTKLMTACSERVWQKAGSNGSIISDLDFQSAWETSFLQDGNNAILTNYVGGHRGVEIGKDAAEKQAEKFISQYDKIFPGTSAAYKGVAVRAHWPTMPFMYGSYACYKPGQYTTIAGVEQEAVGGLHFAGEHTAGNFAGYINGACQSGERAAAEIIARIIHS
jgi:monoamine oxidase